MKIKHSLLFTLLMFFFSCHPNNQFESHFEQYYRMTDSCFTNKLCLVNMQDITWFDWDTMKFRENDSGSFLSFYFSGKAVYSYYKPKSLDGAIGVAFGFGNQLLNNTYAKDSAIFKLKIEKKQAESVFFLLPK